MKDRSPKTFRLPLVVTALAALTLYLTTLAGWHTWDAMAYTARIHDNELLSERFPSTMLWHPHHVLFVVLGKTVVRIASILPGAGGNPFLPLQVMNALFGAACVGLLASIAFRWTGSRPVSIFAAILFGVTQSTWRFATEVEVMTPALLFILLATRVAISTESATTTRDVVWLALFAALAILLHQIACLFWVAMLVWLVVRARHGALAKPQLGLFLGLSFVVVGSVYVTTGLAQLASPSLTGFVEWMLFARSRSTFDTAAAGPLLVVAIKGLLHSFVAAYGITTRRFDGSGGFVTSLAALVAIAGVVAIVLAALFPVFKRDLRGRTPVLVMFVWFSLVALFALWFQPYNIEYWIYAIPPLLLLSAITLARATRRTPGAAGVVFLFALATVNWSSAIRPRQTASNAVYWEAVTIAREHMKAGDAILVGDDATDVLPASAIVALPLLAGVTVIDASSASSVATTLARMRGSDNTAYVLGRVTGRLPQGYALYRVDDITRWTVFRLSPAP